MHIPQQDAENWPCGLCNNRYHSPCSKHRLRFKLPPHSEALRGHYSLCSHLILGER